MSESTWWTYVQTVVGDVASKDIADRVGIDKSNVTRWKQGSRPAVDFVLKFARTYDRPVVEALAASEYITQAEARIREVRVGVSELSDLALARELYERAQRRDSVSSAGATVTRIRSLDDIDHAETPDLSEQPWAAMEGTRRVDEEHPDE